MMSAQEWLWTTLDAIGPWLWLTKPGLCVTAFFILLWRAPPVCWLERAARFLCFIGLLGIVASLFNSALGPLSDALFFGGYLLTLIHRRVVEAAQGHVRPPTLKVGESRPDGPRHWSPLGAIALAVVLLLPVADAVAQAGRHGHGHAQHHDWYKGLMQPNGSGMSCCDNRDCRPTRAYVDDDGWWRALVDGRWLSVPPSIVLKTIAPDGGSHICVTSDGRMLCFVGGVPKS